LPGKLGTILIAFTAKLLSESKEFYEIWVPHHPQTQEGKARFLSKKACMSAEIFHPATPENTHETLMVGTTTAKIAHGATYYIDLTVDKQTLLKNKMFGLLPPSDPQAYDYLTIKTASILPQPLPPNPKV
jgi:hypothetical protein